MFLVNFNNLKLALGMALKFNSKLTERLKLKFKKFWELIPIYLEVIREKLVGGEGGGLFQHYKLDL